MPDLDFAPHHCRARRDCCTWHQVCAPSHHMVLQLAGYAADHLWDERKRHAAAAPRGGACGRPVPWQQVWRGWRSAVSVARDPRVARDRCACARCGARARGEHASTMHPHSSRWRASRCLQLPCLCPTLRGITCQVLLDLHAFPGGSSSGTYNGVWPLDPAFWKADAPGNFRTIVGGLISWMEELAARNATAFKVGARY